MSSLQTTLARAAAREAAAAWKRHHSLCSACRIHAPRCDPGRLLHDDHRAATRELAAAILADARPVPGQRALFP